MGFARYRHLVRLLIVMASGLGLALAVYVLVRPKSFGAFGHYRGNALVELRQRTPHFAGRTECAGCHTDEDEALGKGRHQRLSCETCHGPMAEHAADPSKENATVPKDDGFCLLCHERSGARPSFLPQIQSAQHHRGQACRSCHTPHQPKPKEAP
jgi:hypothetical protein